MCGGSGNGESELEPSHQPEPSKAGVQESSLSGVTRSQCQPHKLLPGTGARNLLSIASKSCLSPSTALESQATAPTKGCQCSKARAIPNATSQPLQRGFQDKLRKSLLRRAHWKRQDQVVGFTRSLQVNSSISDIGKGKKKERPSYSVEGEAGEGPEQYFQGTERATPEGAHF